METSNKKDNHGLSDEEYFDYIKNVMLDVGEAVPTFSNEMIERIEAEKRKMIEEYRAAMAEKHKNGLHNEL